MRRLKNIIIILCMAAVLCCAGCVNVKPFQRAYLNDEEMQLENREVQTFEIDVETYREGASGANGGRSGGGCGCN